MKQISILQSHRIFHDTGRYLMKIATLVSALLLVLIAPLSAQRAADTPSIKDKVAGMRKLEGFFDIYWEEKAEWTSSRS